MAAVAGGSGDGVGGAGAVEEEVWEAAGLTGIGLAVLELIM
jgi:hypothetical protein